MNTAGAGLQRKRFRAVLGQAISILLLLHSASAAAQQDLELAARLQANGSLAQARALYEKLVPEFRGRGNARDLAFALQHLSEIDIGQAKYQDAIARSSECAVIFRQLRNATGEVTCRTSTGRAQVASGDFAAAFAAFQPALVIARENGLAEAEVTLLNNDGNVHYFLGKYEDARRDYGQAETILAYHSAAPWYARRHVITLANQAILYQRVGQYSRALGLYSLLRSDLKSLRSTEQAQMLINMGTLYRRLGDPMKALETYRTAEEIIGPNGDPASEVSVAKNTAIALALDLHRLDSASAMFERALAYAAKAGNRRETVQSMLYLGETRLRMKDQSGAGESFRSALALAREAHLVEDEWKCLYGLGRIAALKSDFATALGLYQDAIGVIESIRAESGAPAMRAGFLADKRDVYDGAIGLLLDRPDPPVARIFRLIERAKARSFQDRAAAFSRDVSLNEISASLPPGVLMLDYWMSESRMAVIWIRNSGSGIAQGSSPRDGELEALEQELAKGTRAGWRPLASGLSAKLLPVPLTGATSLIVVPDGALQLLPFDVLSVPGSGDAQILIEKMAVSYSPAAGFSLIRKRTESANWIPPWRFVFAGFADPKPGAEGMFPGDSASLPNSSIEVRAAAEALGGRARLHIGADDQKSYLSDERHRQVPVLHLATHAVADSDDADRSRILFSPAAPGQPADYLFAREIYGMDLSGVRLAVLSACDTERGTSVRGEGVQSFSRAFLAAGASSVITTFWTIGDRTSAQFWERYYSHLASRETASQSLREAKLEFYRSHSGARHPKYWSVFALNGDPESRPPRSLPWAALAAPVAGLAAAILLWRARAGG